MRCRRMCPEEWSGESVSSVIYKSWCSRGKQRFHPKYLWGLSPRCTSTNILPPRSLLWNFSQGNKIWLVPLGLAVWSKRLFHFRFHTVHPKEYTQTSLSVHDRRSAKPRWIIHVAHFDCSGILHSVLCTCAPVKKVPWLLSRVLSPPTERTSSPW